MWRAMFVEQIPLTEKILRPVLVYALIAMLFRVAGKRGLANRSRNGAERPGEPGRSPPR